MATQDVRIKIKADSAQAVRSLGKVRAGLNKLGPSFAQMRRAALLATGAVTAAVGALAVASVKAASDFETATTDMAKVTKRDLGTLKKEVKALDASFGNATELMKGYYQVISAGVTDPKKAIETLTVASKAAKAAHIEQAEVIKGLTKLMAGYEGELKSVSEAADLLFTIEKEGQTSFQELIPVIGSLAKLSKDLGVNYNEMAGALAQITQTSGSTEEAATRYRSLLVGLMKPTADMSKAIKSMGFESAQQAIESIGFIGVLKNLKEQTRGSSEAMAKLLGRQESLIAISAVSANNFKTVADKIESMGGKTGATEAAFDRWKKTTDGLWDTLKNRFTNVLIEIGDTLLPAVKTALTNLNSVLTDNKDEIIAYAKNFVTGMGAAAEAAVEFGGFVVDTLAGVGALARNAMLVIAKLEKVTAKGLLKSLPKDSKAAEIMRDRLHEINEQIVDLAQGQISYAERDSVLGKVRELVKKLKADLIEVNTAEVAPKIDADDDQAKQKISFIRLELHRLDKTVARPKVIVETFTKASPIMPFTQGMDYMKEKIASLTSMENMTLDLSGFANTFLGIANTMRQLTNPYSSRHPGYRSTEEVLSPQRALVQPLYSFMKDMLRQMQSGMGSGGGGGATTININASGLTDVQGIANAVEGVLADRIKYGRSPLGAF